MKRFLIPIIVIIIIVIVVVYFIFPEPNKDLSTKAKAENSQSSMMNNKINHKKEKNHNLNITEKKDFPEIKDLEKDASTKDTEVTSNLAEYNSDNIELTRIPVNNPKSVEVYKTPYFQISYPVKNWEYAEGKSIDLPAYVDVPKNVAKATVQFINKQNGNSIFLHISYSGGADFDKMNQSEIEKYIQYVYNDYRIKDITIVNKKALKFAVIEFTPGNDSSVLVEQYLTTKADLLYNLTFIEQKSSPISQVMVNEIFKSLQIR